MGNCVQCYPCYVKSNLQNNQSFVYIPQVINDNIIYVPKPGVLSPSYLHAALISIDKL